MDTRPDLPPRPGIGLAAAGLLEVGLASLEVGHLPAAIGSLAAIDEAAWSAILDRFPNLPALIEKWSSPR
jgi:hypothetical protein